LPDRMPDYVPDRSLDESKLKKHKKKDASGGIVIYPWQIGVFGGGMLILGLGAWFLQHSQGLNRPMHPHSTSWHNNVGQQVFEPMKQTSPELDTSPDIEIESTDSLEDVLAKLEHPDAAASALPKKKLNTVTREKKSKPIKKAQAEEPAEEKPDKEKAKEAVRQHIRKLEAEGGKNSAKNRKAIANLKRMLEEADEPEPTPEEKKKAQEEEEDHTNFARALKEEQQRKIHVKLSTVKKEYKEEFGSDAKALLCSGCKMVAARVTEELDDHDVDDQETPYQMIMAKRKAIDSTCSSLRHLQVVKPEDESARFEPSEEIGEGEKEGKRLCAAILEESRFDMMARMMQRKIPVHAMMHGRNLHTNWERFICAERTKLCKRSETKAEDEEEQEL